MHKYSILNDEELMFHLQKGEALAFDVLYNRYCKRLLGYFIRMFNHDKDKAEDALQDLFLKIVERPGSFDTKKVFRTWIFAIAYNICKNHYKHNEIKSGAHRDIRNESEELDQQFFVQAASRLDAVRFRKSLDDVLNDLPVDKKTSFVLRYQEDKSILEIAEIMNCSEGTVKSRIHYTLKIVAEKLKMFNPVM